MQSFYNKINIYYGGSSSRCSSCIYIYSSCIRVVVVVVPVVAAEYIAVIVALVVAW